MKTKLIFLCFVTLIAASMSFAGQVTPLTQMVSGATASAADVNGNFTALETEVNDNDTRLADHVADAILHSDTLADLSCGTDELIQFSGTSWGCIADPTPALQALEARVVELETLLTHFSRIDNDVTIAGANLHIVSGSGNTAGTMNGTGNLIIGYNETRDDGSDDRTGSHNLVVGAKHNYSSYGGLVVGSRNTISAAYASVSGGYQNTAGGVVSSISGGRNNIASGIYSSVSGGQDNAASNTYSSVSGGFGNTASGDSSSVSGGAGREASGIDDWVGGSITEDF